MHPDASRPLTVDLRTLRLVKRKARQVADAIPVSPADQVDIEQDLLLEVLLVLPRHEAQRATQATYVAMVLRHAAARLVQHHSTLSRVCPGVLCSLQEVRVTSEGEEIQREEQWQRSILEVQFGAAPARFEEQCALRVDVERVVRTLPAELRRLCRYLGQVNTKEAAVGTGIARQTVLNYKARLREAFERAGLREYLR